MNTGIPSRSTADGTFPVYSRFQVTQMTGTDPNLTKYDDTVYWVSYFNGGDALHYLPRAGYGYGQSLCCVEMQYDPGEVRLAVNDLRQPRDGHRPDSVTMTRRLTAAEAGERDETPPRPITFRAAEDLGAFELAQLWADRTAWPIDERTQYDELSELAVMSGLGTWLRRWQPIAIHCAMLAGARSEAIQGGAWQQPASCLRSVA